MTRIKTAFLCILLLSLQGCMLGQDLENFGKPPAFSPQIDPFHQPTVENVTKRMAPGSGTPSPHPQSLWGDGRRSFFKDQRANDVGDIVTVTVAISGEKAKLENNSERSRTSTQGTSLTNFFGVKAPGVVGGTALGLSSNPTYTGGGKVDRKEDVTVSISAMVVAVLPNGYLRIQGQQEMRLNFEMREIFISGIVRPEDIKDGNTVDWNRVAEGRLSYGGRGQISQFQQPPYGQQMLDMIMPF